MSDGWQIECEGGTYECRLYRGGQIVDRFDPPKRSLASALEAIDRKESRNAQR